MLKTKEMLGHIGSLSWVVNEEAQILNFFRDIGYEIEESDTPIDIVRRNLEKEKCRLLVPGIDDIVSMEALQNPIVDVVNKSSDNKMFLTLHNANKGFVVLFHAYDKNGNLLDICSYIWSMADTGGRKGKEKLFMDTLYPDGTIEKHIETICKIK